MNFKMASARTHSRLLVSVRTSREAEAALTGGADVIDVKEPANGPLGRASDAAIVSVLEIVAGRRPVSAAMGELAEGLTPPGDRRLAYVKWGLAGLSAASPGANWQCELTNLARGGRPQLVIVGYADWQCAKAPDLDDVVAFACRAPGNVLLVDTHCKDTQALGKSRRPSLLDWLSVKEASILCARCREAGVKVALAGSLGHEEVEHLKDLCPDWFAVRGSACEENDRGGTIDAEKVRRLAQMLER